MKFKLSILLAIAALAVAVGAGVARADNSDWCGQTGCDASGDVAYVQCSDGTIWEDAVAVMDADTFGDLFCGGDYTVLQPPADSGSDQGNGTTTSCGSDCVTSGGVDLNTLTADPYMAPDPTLYGDEVQCPDGSIWAVAIGDDFVCPTS